MCLHLKCVVHRDDSVVCTECGQVLTDHGSLTNVDPLCNTNHKLSSYRRKHHINERLSQLNINESAVPDKLMRHLKKYLFPIFEACGDITKPHVQRALQYLGRREGRNFTTKYLEKWLQIRYKVTGKRPNPLNESEKESVIRIYIAFEQFFEYNKHPSRKHIANVNHVLRHCCRLIGRKDLYKYLPLMLDEKKKVEHDKFFKYYCETSGIPFESVIYKEKLCFYFYSVYGKNPRRRASPTAAMG